MNKCKETLNKIKKNRNISSQEKQEKKIKERVYKNSNRDWIKIFIYFVVFSLDFLVTNIKIKNK